MGNFLSNQRIESMDDTPNSQWTERGVLMDIRIQKENGQTSIRTAQAHPTWVNRISQERIHWMVMSVLVIRPMYWKIGSLVVDTMDNWI